MKNWPATAVTTTSSARRMTSTIISAASLTTRCSCTIRPRPGPASAPGTSRGMTAGRPTPGPITTERSPMGKPGKDAARYDIADLVACEDTGPYFYVAGDCTRAYSPGKLKCFTRQIVFLRPGTFVVFDRVVACDPSYRKTWLLQAMSAAAARTAALGDHQRRGAIVRADALSASSRGAAAPARNCTGTAARATPRAGTPAPRRCVAWRSRPACRLAKTTFCMY